MAQYLRIPIITLSFLVALILTIGALRATVMSPDDFMEGDLNRDGLCNHADRELFDGAVGTCRGWPGYKFFADFDRNGCVEDLDRYFLFVVDNDRDGIPNTQEDCPSL